MSKKDTADKNPNRNLKVLLPIIILFLFFILPLVTCPLWGQVVQKKDVTPSDYHLWGELNLDKIAPDQQWASYKMSYDNAIDTLFVRNISNNKTYNYPNGDNSIFTKNNEFICLSNQTLQIQNLKTGEIETIAGVNEYRLSQDTNQLIIHITTGENKNTLLIRSDTGHILKNIANVTRFSLSPNGKTLVYNSVSNNKNSLLLIDLRKINYTKSLLNGTTENYDGFSWQKQGKSVAFMGQSENRLNSTLFYYTVTNDKLYTISSLDEPEFPNDSYITLGQKFKILISDDLQKVFFAFKNKTNSSQNKQDSNVEVWNANDKWIYPEQQNNGLFQEYAKLALWLPFSNHCTPITTSELPKVILSGNLEYAIVSNPKQYDPQFEYEGNSDFYIINLKTFEKSLFLKNQSRFFKDILPSPGGKYIAYFRENNWWIYDIANKIHKNSTHKIKGSFIGKIYKTATESAYGSFGWSPDDKDLLIYDQYDLWAIRTDGRSYKRVTHGRESKIRYRIADAPNENILDFLYDGLKSNTINLETELFLRAEGEDGKTGYFKWKKGANESPIIYEDRYIDQFLYSSKKRKYFFREQKFDLPPRFITIADPSNTKTIFQSNPHHYNYNWGVAELIEHQNSKKENLKGVLLYPANYDPQKKYPMIVHIYELRSKELYRYTNPSLYDESGFNTTVFTTKGYFVLLPDIISENKNPGISALDCVTAATRNVIKKGVVKPDKIGLIGHSFGGYETAFIITQTQLFKTAVAGGAVCDFNSFYFSVGWNTGRPNIWRFQNGQFRMTKSPFEDPLSYLRNSPIASANNVTTPLLSWTGKNDNQVDWHQSVEYHLALRRLNKKNILLLYPDEGHVVLNPTNQKDLSDRIQQWFGYYLKEELPSQWITDGVK